MEDLVGCPPQSPTEASYFTQHSPTVAMGCSFINVLMVGTVGCTNHWLGGWLAEDQTCPLAQAPPYTRANHGMEPHLVFSRALLTPWALQPGLMCCTQNGEVIAITSPDAPASCSCEARLLQQHTPAHLHSRRQPVCPMAPPWSCLEVTISTRVAHCTRASYVHAVTAVAIPYLLPALLYLQATTTATVTEAVEEEAGACPTADSATKASAPSPSSGGSDNTAGVYQSCVGRSLGCQDVISCGQSIMQPWHVAISRAVSTSNARNKGRRWLWTLPIVPHRCTIQASSFASG
jgi:hypothetical protein